MFFNIKFKTCLKIILVFLICFSILFISKIFSNKVIMTTENYTAILKEYHDEPYKYEGQKIKTSGYVFRTKDFKENQFVIARDMLINETDSQIVGFLCEYPNASEILTNEWISAEGIIHIGNYYGPMPILHLIKFKSIPKPNSPFVFLPDETRRRPLKV